MLTVKSGDEVTVDTVTGCPDMVPDRSSFTFRPSLRDPCEGERMCQVIS